MKMGMVVQLIPTENPNKKRKIRNMQAYLLEESLINSNGKVEMNPIKSAIYMSFLLERKLCP